MTSATHSLVKALRSVPDFSVLDDHALLQVAGGSTNLFWPAGSTIFEPGSPSDELYIVLAGEVSVVDPDEGREVEVSRVGPGESFGELSLLLARQHSKIARAVEDTELLVLPKESFDEVLAGNPDLAEQFQRRLEERTSVPGKVPDST
jgi:CRP/FNR family cyclic AMP-dependent transcriptional regulator